MTETHINYEDSDKSENNNDTIVIEHNGIAYEQELTDELRESLIEAGVDLPTQSTEKLIERVEELLYNIIEVKPREKTDRTEVVITDELDGEASLDHGQPQKLDEADDVEIRMIRPDRIVVGWSDQE